MVFLETIKMLGTEYKRFDIQLQRLAPRVISQFRIEGKKRLLF
ncbi:hypothetical protein [Bacillus sp. SA1-12]|nr:hypothetical protein [Bacillus sp. SA1-12]